MSLKYVGKRSIWYLKDLSVACYEVFWDFCFFNILSQVNELLLNTILSALSWNFSNFLSSDFLQKCHIV